MMVSQITLVVSRLDTFDACHIIILAAIKPNTSLNIKYSQKLVSSFNFQTHTY